MMKVERFDSMIFDIYSDACRSRCHRRWVIRSRETSLRRAVSDLFYSRKSQFFLSFFISFFLVLAFTTVQAADSEVEALFKKGKLLAFNGKTEEAIAVFREVIKKDPKSIEAHREYQHAQWLVDREALFKEYAERAKTMPEDADSLYLYGSLLCTAGKLDEGKKYIDQCLKLQPKHYWGRNSLLGWYMYNSQQDQAKQIIDELLEENSQDIIILLAKAMSALFKKDQKVVEECINRLQAVQTDDLEKQLDICRFLFVVNSVAARARLQTLIEQYPEAPEVLLAQAQVLILEKKYEEAETLLKKAIAIEPRLAGPHKTLSQVYHDMGQYDAARKELEIYDRLATTEISVQLKQSGEVISGQENDASQYEFLGWTYLESGDPEKAETQFRKAIEKDPSLATARYQLAELLWKMERKEEAFGIIEKIDQVPKNEQWRFYSLKGNLLYSEGKISQANGVWQTALKESPPDKIIRDRLQHFIDTTALGEMPKIKRIQNIKQPPCLRKDYCVPASVATVLNFWGKNVDPVEIGKDFVGKGPSWAKTVKFLRAQSGFSCLAFRTTPEAIKICIDQGIPPILLSLIVEVDLEKSEVVGHASTVAGYDDTLQCLLTMESSWGMEERIPYGDIRPAIACILIPTNQQVETNALDIKEGEKLFELILASEAGDEKKALSIFSDLKESTAEGNFLIAASFLKKSKWQEVLPYLKKTIEILPFNVSLRVFTGFVLIEAKEYKEAILHFQKALELEPSSTNTHVLLARALAESGKPEEGFKVMESLPRSELTAPYDRFLLGTLALQLGKMEIVKEQLKFLDLISPEYAQMLRENMRVELKDKTSEDRDKKK